MNQFDNLPNELLQHILSHDGLNLSNINLVSKRFHDNVGQVKVVRLKSNTSLETIERLSKIYKVSVNLRCTNITDMYMLSNVHTLDLCGTNITDVSMLGGVHTLNLGSTKVIDVSMLGGVHTLNLCGTKVTDVSMLGCVHTLYLYGSKVKDVSMLENTDIHF